MLLLHSLSHILIHSASSHTICVAVLTKKEQQQLTDPPKAEIVTIQDEDAVITIDGDDGGTSTGQGKMDCSPTADVTVVSETGSKVGTSGAANTAPSGSGHVTQITLGMLSTALQNVNQSLGMASSTGEPSADVTEGPNSQSDKDTVGLPGGKKPRLESSETTTIKQDTLSKDIHDKLHSNIK